MSKASLGLNTVLNLKTVSGHGVGKILGFPTLNFEYDDELRGVFAAWVVIDGSKEAFRSAINIGARPTFEDARVGLEAHLLDLEELEIESGHSVEIVLVKKIRETKKFDSKEALIEQISMDVEKVKELL